MAVTLADLLNRLAYRLRENSSPDDTNEKTRRVSAINEGYRKICGERYWWFLKTSGSTTTVASQETYTLPANFRDLIEVRVDGLRYDIIQDTEAFDTAEYPPSSTVPKCFVYGENELHLLPVPTASGITIAYRYYQYVNDLVSDTDTIIIPDLYSDILPAYAYGRLKQTKGLRGSAGDGFEEYNQIYNNMLAEHNRRKFMYKNQ